MSQKLQQSLIKGNKSLTALNIQQISFGKNQHRKAPHRGGLPRPHVYKQTGTKKVATSFPSTALAGNPDSFRSLD